MAGRHGARIVVKINDGNLITTLADVIRQKLGQLKLTHAVHPDTVARTFLYSPIFTSKMKQTKTKALRQIGGSIRKIMHQEIKPRAANGRPSLPGEIPKSPSRGGKHRLRDKIQYNIEGANQVVIGPSYAYPGTSTPADINTVPVTVRRRKLVDVKAADPKNRRKIKFDSRGDVELVDNRRRQRRNLTPRQFDAMIERKKKAGEVNKRFIAPELTGKELMKKTVAVRVRQRPYTGPILAKAKPYILDAFKHKLT